MNSDSSANASSDLAKIGEAAKILNISVKTLRRWELAGKLKAFRSRGGTRLYSLADLKTVGSKNNPLNLNSDANLLKIGEAAKKIGISVKTLRRWESQGKIKAIYSPGKTRYYSTTGIEKYSQPNQPNVAVEPISSQVISKLPLNSHQYQKIKVVDQDSKELKVGLSKDLPRKNFRVKTTAILVTVLIFLIFATALVLANLSKITGGNKDNSLESLLLKAIKRDQSGSNLDNNFRVLGVSTNSAVLKLNSNVSIQGKLTIRDTINGINIAALPDNSGFNLSAGAGILNVTGANVTLDQSFTASSSPTLTGLTLSNLTLTSSSNQILFKTNGITGTLSWSPSSSDKTITLPDATTTVLGTNTTQTITNKTISGSSNTLSSISNSSLSNSSITISTSGTLSGGGAVSLGGSITLTGSSSNSACSDCLINDPSSTQTIAPTGNITGLSIKQTTTSSPTADIFNVTNSGGTTKYLKVDSTGNVGIGNTAPAENLDIAGNIKLYKSSTSRADIYTASTTEFDKTWTSNADFNASGTAYSSGMLNPSINNQLELINNGFGTGTDGAVTFSSSVNINSTNSISGRSCADGGDAVNYSVTALTSTTATLSSTPSSGCLASGDELLLINLEGTSSSTTNVGNYETIRVSSVSSNVVTFSTSKTKFYGDGASNDTNVGTASTNQRIMLQRIPNYTTVTVNNGGTITGSAWNGTNGGVVYFRANTSLTVNSGGSISANALGYAIGSDGSGCTYGNQGESFGGVGTRTTAANNGGGGGAQKENCPNGSFFASGGGGAGYGAAGTTGNAVSGGTAGTGGSSYGVADLSKLYLGSAGGASGYGGGCCASFTSGPTPGAGMVIVATNTLTVAGTISANASNATCSGGGGTGGSILLSGNSVTVGTTLVTATGGTGGTFCGDSNRGTGGAGAVGRIAIRYVNSLSGTTSPAANTSTNSSEFTYTTGDRTWTSDTQDAGSGKTFRPSRFTATWTLDGSDNIAPKFQLLGSSTGSFTGEETTYPAGSGTYYQNGGTYSLTSGTDKDVTGEVTGSFRYFKVKVTINTGTTATDTPSVQDVRLRDNFGLILQASGHSVGVGTTTPAGEFDVANKLVVYSGGNVGIGSTTTATANLDITGTYNQTYTGTTGTGSTLTASSITTGTALSLIGPTSTGVTSGTSSGFAKIASNVGSAGTSGVLLYLNPSFSASSATTAYGTYLNGTDSTSTANTDYGNYSSLVLTGNGAKVAAANFGGVSSASTTADTLVGYDTLSSTWTTSAAIITSGTRNIYGFRSQPTSTAASTGGTTNVYGIYAKAGGTLAAGGTINAYGVYVANGSMNTTGTTSNYELYLETPSGATNNYALYSNGGTNYFGGNVGIGITNPNAKLDVLTTSGDLIRTSYDTSNYAAFTESSTGATTLTFNGQGEGLTLSYGTTITAVGTTPGSAAPTALSLTGPTGGNTTITTSGTGGVGGPVTLTGGIGGTANSVTGANNSTGGKGGNLSFTGGSGGAASATDTGTNTGGAGGDLFIVGGTGGAASNGSTNTAGASGNVLLAITSGGTARGNVGIGTTAPGAKFDVNATCTNFQTSHQCTDYAEIYPASEPVERGEIVSVDNQNSTGNEKIVKKSSSAYDNKILGVVSTNPAVVIEGNSVQLQSGANYHHDPLNPALALAGRVPLKVSVENGPISRGDYLTSSSTPGIAMKAIKPGQMVAKALEDYSNNGIGMIKAFITISYADPTNVLASLTINSDGTLIIPKIAVDRLQVTSDLVVDGNLKVGNTTIDATSLLAVGTVVSDIEGLKNITTQLASDVDSIKANIQSRESRVKSLEDKQATDSAQLAEVKDLTSKVDSQNKVLAASVASSSANIASLSSQIDSLMASFGLGNKESSPSAKTNLTDPGTLIASDSAKLANLDVAGKISSFQIQASNFQTLDATVSGTFKALGDTFLGKTTIAGDLTVDGTFSVTGTSINALPTLYIQNSSLASLVDFFNGLVTISKDGNLSAERLILSDTSLGEGKINKGQTAVVIPNASVKPNSKVFITATKPVAIGVTKQDVTNHNFIVEIGQPLLDDLTFNWWIVDQK